MSVGAMKYRLELQKPNPVKDTYNQPVAITNDDWVTVATVWGDVQTLNSKEQLTANGITSIISHKVKIGYRRDVKDTMRFKYGERILNIVSAPLPLGTTYFLEISCLEKGG